MTITTEQAIAHLAACTDAQASNTARACVHLAGELVRAREQIASLRTLVYSTEAVQAKDFSAAAVDDPCDYGEESPFMPFDGPHCCWACVRRAMKLPSRMILCPTCGNKRCPKASDHELACTDSNEPGQPGSVF